MKTATCIRRGEQELEACLKKIEISDISNRNKQIIYDFYNSASSEDPSTLRIVKLVYASHLFAHLLQKDFDRATKKDIG